MCQFSWGIWDAPELWTSISKLMCRTNACYFFSMLKIHSSPFCSHTTGLLLSLQPTAHIQACSVAWLRRPASLQWRCGACVCVNHVSATPSQTLEKLCCLPGRKEQDTCLRVQIISCLSAASNYYLKKSYFDSLPLHFTSFFFPPTSWWHFPQV